MAVAKGSSKPEFELIPEGFYTFQLTEVREETTEENPFKKGAMRTQVPLEWTCRADEDAVTESGEPVDGMTIVQYYTLSLGSPEYPSKLRPFAAALLRREVTQDDEDEGIDLDTLLNRRIQATVKHYAKKDGTKGAKLESPLPVKRKPKEEPKAAPPPADDDDDDDLGPFAASA
jgi:hypothetical protein